MLGGTVPRVGTLLPVPFWSRQTLWLHISSITLRRHSILISNADHHLAAGSGLKSFPKHFAKSIREAEAVTPDCQTTLYSLQDGKDSTSPPQRVHVDPLMTM